MATEDDLRSFLESRLISLDPAIDLSDNSPAQLKVITPILARIGEDPFSTDLPTFIKDRLVQEFPELSADNAGMLEDILSKPMQMLLEPIKREIELVRIGASVTNAAIMADAEADAIGANWFTQRDEGDHAGGLVRIYFAQPTTARVTTDKRLYTSDGRTFFPIQNYQINMGQMAFNRQGTFYFLDITVRAEATGEDYNVAQGEINGIEDVPGVIKVANLTAFVTGDARETNEEYITRVESSLTERSLVTKRGISARVTNEFDSIKALQIVGAGDEGMDRDILTGTGQGFLHLAGEASIFGDWLWVSKITYRDDGTTNSITPQPGDTIRFHPTTPAPPATDMVEAKVTSILSQGALYQLDSSPYGAGSYQRGAFALLKPGTITISGVPGGIAANISVADNQLHLGGHTDVFARPTQDAEVQTTIANVTGDDPIIAITDLVVPTANQNLVTSTSSNFITKKIVPGDLLVIDTGAGFAGTYQILEVPSSNSLRLDSVFSFATTTELRARIVRNIKVDLIAPKVPKLPFTASPVSDLQTNVGSNEFNFASINIQDYGSAIGDTIKVLEGADAGEFTIIGFGPVSGNVFVDRVASATGANLSYEVFTQQTGLARPIVRLKGIEVLDSTGQATGVTVPYGDAVDIRSSCDLEGAGQGKTTYDKHLLVFPDLSEWANGGLADDFVGLGSITNSTDARYTLGLASADGIVRKVTHDAANQIETSEINIPPFVYNGRRDKLIALVSHEDNNFPTAIAGTHKTSDLAESKIGDSLTINDGPNQGKYIIKDLRILELWGKAEAGHRKVALIQVDPPLKSDPIRTGLDLINYENGSAFYTPAQLFGLLQYAADWDNASGFYAGFITKLRSSLATLGISTYASDAALQTTVDALLRTGYTVGPSAKGTFRTYFLEPVSAEFNFGIDPTTFDLASDGSKKFRISPDLPPAQILPEAVTETAPSLWNRDLGVRASQDTYAYLTSTPSFALRGIRAGDTLEWYPAINDLPARGNMSSSWMCVTQAGSNIVQLIVPTTSVSNEGLDNYVAPAPGQLFFIDSGPDTGAYVVTKVLDSDFASSPPTVRLQLDQTLTHSTESFPVNATATTPPAQLDFSSGLPAYVQGTSLTFPLSLNGKNLEVDVSTDGGNTYTTVNHVFAAANPYANIDAVIADIAADAAFIAQVTAVANGNALVLIKTTSTPRARLRISTSPSVPSAHSTLGLTDGTEGSGVRGAATLPGTKRLYGSGLGSFQVNDWITVYAANGGTVITDGEDEAYIGTYLVTAVGTDQAAAPFWTPVSQYIELDRTANFPSGNPVSVRWLRHEEPETEPANTSDGGKEISDQFVRFRMYDAVSKTLSVANIPWAAATVHPLLSTSTQQIELESPGIVNTGNGDKNYSHKSPFRILRPDVLRISSTNMANQREGALYYVDLPVVGYGPGEEMNVSPDEGFVLSGNFEIEGYTLEVNDDNFTYSMQEQLHIVLPNSVLPVGATADLNNKFNLSGQNLQVTYNNAPAIEDLQAFFDSPADRVTAANMLVRHFLPGYVFFDAVYAGGASEAVSASEVVSYINNIDPNTAEIRTDLLKDAITKRGATTVDLPLTVIVLFHGIDRRIRGMRSTKSIGLGDTPFFKGNFRQTYFIAGPNTSRSLTRPVGEQVYLRRT